MKMTDNAPIDEIREHTQGPWRSDEGTPNFCLPNVRRMEACWNICEGIPTEDLEGGPVGEILKKAFKKVMRDKS